MKGDPIIVGEVFVVEPSIVKTLTLVERISSSRPLFLRTCQQWVQGAILVSGIGTHSQTRTSGSCGTSCNGAQFKLSIFKTWSNDCAQKGKNTSFSSTVNFARTAHPSVASCHNGVIHKGLESVCNESDWCFIDWSFFQVLLSW